MKGSQRPLPNRPANSAARQRDFECRGAVQTVTKKRVAAIFLGLRQREPEKPSPRRRRESSNWEGRQGTCDDSRRANLHPFRVDTIESASLSDTLHARGSRIEARGASSRERASPSRGVRAAHRASRRGSRAVFSSAFQSAARALSASPRRASRVPNLTPRVPRSRAQKGKMAQTPTFKLILVGDGGTGA